MGRDGAGSGSRRLGNRRLLLWAPAAGAPLPPAPRRGPGRVLGVRRGQRRKTKAPFRGLGLLSVAPGERCLGRARRHRSRRASARWLDRVHGGGESVRWVRLGLRRGRRPCGLRPRCPASQRRARPGQPRHSHRTGVSRVGSLCTRRRCSPAARRRAYPRRARPPSAPTLPLRLATWWQSCTRSCSARLVDRLCAAQSPRGFPVVFHAVRDGHSRLRQRSPLLG